MVKTRSSSIVKIDSVSMRATKRRKVEDEAVAPDVSRVRAISTTVSNSKASRKQKFSTTDAASLGEAEAPEPTPKKRSKKSTLSELPQDYPEREESPWKVGAHVSAAGGVENAVLNAARIGANAFALFLKSQHKWVGPPFTEQSIQSFQTRMKTFGYSPNHVLPHGSYLINMGNPDAEKREKAYTCFLDELRRCEQLGLLYYNFHPGSTVGLATPEESMGFIADCINRAHKETTTAVPVIENMAGAGNVIGSKFEELAGIIDRVTDKSRVGICLDTCHMFAAGFDIRTKEGWDSTITDFDRIVGLKYLRGMHLNDSKATLASEKDRHENIGLGELRLSSFAHILTDPRTQNIPLVLETPMHDEHEVWKTEVTALNRLSNTCGIGAESSTDTPMPGVEESILVGEAEVKMMVEKFGKDKGKGKAKANGGKKPAKTAARGNDEEGERDVEEDTEHGEGEVDAVQERPKVVRKSTKK